MPRWDCAQTRETDDVISKGIYTSMNLNHSRHESSLDRSLLGCTGACYCFLRNMVALLLLIGSVVRMRVSTCGVAGSSPQEIKIGKQGGSPGIKREK